ncbi:DUF5702 domain-containing protein [Parasporobacterium paucivorans]|uniref:Uncharacterized protein n=1 Tax=Parasporobacterium paucivorans DSM 15970 TaxID=1122934 RepID=A0A1M6JAH9_9FIRM|nr:DUF5702 domain-containing protein [Parasporobacterium paucivorans]SHJ43650.1 hypothetical protein SAMN02745691_01955 [Parasporobacterium paucivorans DSM 15970]
MRGSITIFMSLIFTVILSLFCTLIESGRIMAMEAKLTGITRMGMDSAFAGYASPLFEDYGVLFLWTGDRDFSEIVEEYISWNLDMDKGVLPRNTDLYRMKLQSLELTEIKRATDDSGGIFAGQVKEYMKYAALEGAADELMNQAELLGQGTGLINICKKIKEIGEVFEKTEEKISGVREALDKIQNIRGNPEEALSGMKDLLEVMEVRIAGGEDIAVQLDDYRQRAAQLVAMADDCTQKLKEVEEKIDEYEDSMSEIREKAVRMEKELQEEDGQEANSLLQEEVRSLTGQGEDYYGMSSKRETVERYLEKMDTIREILANARMPDMDNLESCQDELEIVRKTFQDFTFGELQMETVSEGSHEEGESLLAYVKRMREEGILGLVLENPGEVSGERIAGENLPSAGGTTEVEETKSLINKAVDRLVYSRYLTDHFGTYAHPKEETALRYELEYILGGGTTDKENLAAAADKLLLIREGCNMLSLLKDKTKRDEAYQMATILAGFTGMPALVTITWFVILGAWAYAESILDVKSLLKGEKITVIKNEDQWNLSLEGVISAGSQKGAVNSVQENGMDYEQYLQIMLLMQSSQQQYFRTMDVIQINLCKRYNPDFRINECICSAEISTGFSARQLFISLPVVQKMLGKKEGEYQIHVTGKYKY